MVHTCEGWKFHAGAGGKESDDDCCCPEDHDDDIPTPPVDCSFCNDPGWPTSWTVEVEGVPAFDCGEGNCSDLNGVYVVNDLTTIIDLNCQTKECVASVCSSDELLVDIFGLAPDTIVDFGFQGDGGGRVLFRINLGIGTQDCSTFNGLILPYNFFNIGGCNQDNNPGIAAATATITANVP